MACDIVLFEVTVQIYAQRATKTTQYRGRVVNTASSYVGGPGFKSRPEHQLF
jgi:hypothetical protein